MKKYKILFGAVAVLLAGCSATKESFDSSKFCWSEFVEEKPIAEVYDQMRLSFRECPMQGHLNVYEMMSTKQIKVDVLYPNVFGGRNFIDLVKAQIEITPLTSDRTHIRIGRGICGRTEAQQKYEERFWRSLVLRKMSDCAPPSL